MSDELYKKYRPTALSELVGQDAAVKTIDALLAAKRLPSAVLLTGPAGCGKTTIARILKEQVFCSDYDFNEQNAADFNGIASIRDLRSTYRLAPMKGPSRVWLLDECHQLSKDAQEALLKLLEDSRKNTYFFLATTHPQKLLPTIRSRCTEIKVQGLKDPDMLKLLHRVCRKEKRSVCEEVLEKIIQLAEGSPRKGLVLLQQIILLDDDEDQLKGVEAAGVEVEAFKICQLLANPRTSWADMSKVLKQVLEADKDVEGIRYMILGYFNSALLGANTGIHKRACLIINVFRDSFYEGKAAALTASCFEVIAGRK